MEGLGGELQESILVCFRENCVVYRREKENSIAETKLTKNL